MSIHTRTGGNWKAVSEVHVKVNGTWRKCKNTYVKVGGVWKPLLSHQESVGIPGIFNTRTVNNVQVGSELTIEGTATNTTWDSGDYYEFQITGATLTSGSLRIGPDPGDYSITLQATATTVSVYLTGNGMSSLTGTITYYSTT